MRDEYCQYDNTEVGHDRREERQEERKEVVVKMEPVDYMAIMEAIKGLTNMMTMLTQNQLNTGVPSRAPEQFPRPPVNISSPASTEHMTDRIPCTTTDRMQVLQNSRALHQGVSNGGGIPKERKGNLQWSWTGNIAQQSLHPATVPRGDTAQQVQQLLQPESRVITGGPSVQSPGSNDELCVSGS